MAGRTQRRWPITGRDLEIDSVVSALNDPDTDVVLVVGPAGVGKSRLAHVCFDKVVSADSAQGGRAIASPSLRSVPFGAVAHLLPDEAVAAAASGGGALQLFSALRSALSTGRPDRFLLMVDDIQHLDEGTVGILVQLISAGLVRVLATQRSGEPMAAGLAAILRSDRMVRVDLGALDIGDVDDLLRAALGSPVHGIALRHLHERSQGNPLYLRELVQTGVDAAALVERDGIWVLDRSVIGEGVLLDILNEKLAGLDLPAREVAEVLALVQPVGLELLEQIHGIDPLAALEDRGIIEITDDGNRHEVRLAHPLYEEILVRDLQAVNRRRLLLRHVDMIESCGSRRREDPVRLVLWRLEAGSSAPIDELVRAARTAWAGKDFDLTRRLGEAVLDAGGDRGVIGPLGDAYYELGQYRQGIELVSTALRNETDELRMVELAMSLHRLLFWGADDPEAALDVLRETSERLTEEPYRDVMLAAEGNVLAFTGRPEAALVRLDRLRFLVPPISTVAAVARAGAFAQTGRTADAIEVAAAGFAEHLELSGDETVVSSALHLITGAFALTEAGRVQEAFEMASSAYDSLVEVDIWLDQAWAAVNAARALLLAGRPRSARRWSQEALAAATRARFTTGIRVSWVIYTAASAQIGDTSGARSGLVQLERMPDDTGFVREETAIGVAWGLVAAEERNGAVKVLLEAAGAARARGLVSSEAFVLHEALRLGAVDGWERLAELADASDSALGAARGLHARAAGTGDAEVLGEASDAFAALGCDLLAAEVAVAASRRFAAAGEDRSAGRWSLRATQLSELCEGASTPGLSMPGEAATALSSREREVAELAAEGWSSKDIASKLFLSVRTVDNHLQHVYTKLGIRGRADLSGALEN